MDEKKYKTDNAILALLLEQQELEEVKQEVGLVSNGDEYETHAGKFFTTDDIITLRDKATVGLGSTKFAGIKAKKYDGLNDGQLVFDADGYARVGDEDSLQMIATRENAPTDKGIAYYDETTRSFKTKAESSLSVAQAVNANKLGGVAASNYARTDIAETFTKNITVNDSVVSTAAVTNFVANGTESNYQGLAFKQDGSNRWQFLTTPNAAKNLNLYYYNSDGSYAGAMVEFVRSGYVQFNKALNAKYGFNAGTNGVTRFSLTDTGTATTGTEVITNTSAGSVTNALKLVNASSTANTGVSIRFATTTAHSSRYASIHGVNDGNNVIDLVFKAGVGSSIEEKFRVNRYGTLTTGSISNDRLTIFNDGSGSTGFKQKLNGFFTFFDNNDARLFRAVSGGAFDAYHNNVMRFSTTANGTKTTGTGEVTEAFYIGTSRTAKLRMVTTDTTYFQSYTAEQTGSFASILFTGLNGANAVYRINSTGTINYGSSSVTGTTYAQSTIHAQADNGEAIRIRPKTTTTVSPYVSFYMTPTGARTGYMQAKTEGMYLDSEIGYLKLNGTNGVKLQHTHTTRLETGVSGVSVLGNLYVNRNTNQTVAHFRQHTGTGYAPASILLEATQADARGQGVFMYNTLANKTWYSGVPYSDQCNSWGVHYEAQTTFNTNMAEKVHRLFSVHKDGITTATGQLVIKAKTDNNQIFRINQFNNDGRAFIIGMSGSNGASIDFATLYSATPVTSFSLARQTGIVSFHKAVNIAGDTTINSANLLLKSSSNGSTGLLRVYNAAGLERGQVYANSNNVTLYGHDKISLYSNGVTVKNTIGSPSYGSGFGGAGWQIDEAGNMNVDSLSVRKTLNVYELNINKIRSGNGSYWFSDGAKIESIGTIDSTYTTLNFPSETGHPFTINDLVRCQVWTGNGIKYYELRISGVAANVTTTSVKVVNSSHEGTGYTDLPKAGDEIVRVGNTVDDTRQGAVYITSNDLGAPYLDVIDGRTDIKTDNKSIKVRVGKLDGITDPDLPSIRGYGLYGQNVFLKGKIVANSGKIGSWTISSSAIYSGNLYGNGGAGIQIGGTSAGTKWFMAKKDDSNFVQMYYNSSTDWGLRGTQTSKGYLFHLGSTNNIAGWTFTDSYLRHAKGTKNLILSNSEGVTVANMGRRGLTMYEDNSTAPVGGVKVVQMGELANAGTANTFGSTSNYGFRILCRRTSSTYSEVIRADKDGAIIAGWKFDYRDGAGGAIESKNQAIGMYSRDDADNNTKGAIYNYIRVNTGGGLWTTRNNSVMLGVDSNSAIAHKGIAATDASGNVLFKLGTNLDNNAANYIAGWTFDKRAIYKNFGGSIGYTYMCSDATIVSSAFAARPSIVTVNNGGGKNNMVNFGNIYKNKTNDGIALFSDYNTNTKVFEVSSNYTTGALIAQIAGWNFNNESLYKTNGSGTYLSFGSPVQWASSWYGLQAGKDGSNRVWVGSNATDTEITAYINSKYYFQAGTRGCSIAGWTFTDTKLYKGNLNLSASGGIYAYKSGVNYWHLKNDGSGQLAQDAIKWDTSGNVTFSSGVKLGWSNADSTLTSRITQGAVPITWVKSSGITVDSDGGVRKSGGSTGWNAQAYSNEGVTGACSLSWTVENYPNNHIMFGLNESPSSSASYSDIDYEFYCDRSYYEVRVNGSTISGTRTAHNNDNAIFGITYDESFARFYVNSKLVHSVAASAGKTLHVDSSFYIAGANTRITNVDFRKGTAYNSCITTNITNNTISTTNVVANNLKVKSANVSGKLTAATIDAAKIDTGYLNAARIATGSLHGNKITAGTITATEIKSNSITADHISGKVLTGVRVEGTTLTTNVGGDSESGVSRSAISIETNRIKATRDNGAIYVNYNYVSSGTSQTIFNSATNRKGLFIYGGNNRFQILQAHYGSSGGNYIPYVNLGTHDISDTRIRGKSVRLQNVNIDGRITKFIELKSGGTGDNSYGTIVGGGSGDEAEVLLVHPTSGQGRIQFGYAKVGKIFYVVNTNDSRTLYIKNELLGWGTGDFDLRGGEGVTIMCIGGNGTKDSFGNTIKISGGSHGSRRWKIVGAERNEDW